MKFKHFVYSGVLRPVNEDWISFGYNHSAVADVLKKNGGHNSCWDARR